MSNPILVEVFGRMVQLVRTEGGWRLFLLGNEGKKGLVEEYAASSVMSDAEVLDDLDDLSHEWAIGTHTRVRRIDPASSADVTHANPWAPCAGSSVSDRRFPCGRQGMFADQSFVLGEIIRLDRQFGAIHRFRAGGGAEKVDERLGLLLRRKPAQAVLRHVG